MYKHYSKEENLAKLESGLVRAAQSLRDTQQARLERIIE
jgi:hypothetical protein